MTGEDVAIVILIAVLTVALTYALFAIEQQRQQIARLWCVIEQYEALQKEQREIKRRRNEHGTL